MGQRLVILLVLCTYRLIGLTPWSVIYVGMLLILVFQGLTISRYGALSKIYGGMLLISVSSESLQGLVSKYV